ncbi:MAG: cytochrome c oxidase subunit II [Acidobacteria bacterium]|nr:cytochrome c oxidase subunit II [Acidobacteriota bacterium]
MLSGIPLFPEQASTLAPKVDNLYFFVTAVTAFFALLVVVLVTIFAIKYRDRTGEKVGSPIHGSIPLEIGWTIIPFFVAMVIFAWSTIVFFHIVRAPDQALEIYSTGKRWMWRFQHLEGQSEINELHVPLGLPVKVVFTSEDVLHSLYIPAFRVKADAIPGRYSSIWFTPTKAGEHHLFCAEYCGTKHSGMIGKVVVMEPNDYQAWLSGGDLSMSARGEQLFQQLGCVSCHLNNGSGRGPSLAGKYGTQETLANGTTVAVDDRYIRESILTPQMKLVVGYQPLMPTFQGLVNEEGVMSLIEYIKSLPSTGRPAATTQAGAAVQGAAPALAPADGGPR